MFRETIYLLRCFEIDNVITDKKIHHHYETKISLSFWLSIIPVIHKRSIDWFIEIDHWILTYILIWRALAVWLWKDRKVQLIWVYGNAFSWKFTWPRIVPAYCLNFHIFFYLSENSYSKQYCWRRRKKDLKSIQIKKCSL